MNFSGRGPTSECIIKPDVIAPGSNIISCLAEKGVIRKSDNTRVVSEYYLQMSGTSMSTPIVTGAVALLLQKHPSLRPDDVKYMLKKCAVDLKYPPNQQGWGLLNIEKLISGEAEYVR